MRSAISAVSAVILLASSASAKWPTTAPTTRLATTTAPRRLTTTTTCKPTTIPKITTIATKPPTTKPTTKPMTTRKLTTTVTNPPPRTKLTTTTTCKPTSTTTHTKTPTRKLTTRRMTTTTAGVVNDCQNAVSTSTRHTNDYCMKACQVGIDHGKQCHSLPEWSSGACITESYDIQDGRVDVSGSHCFSNFVYGYSEPAADSAMDGEWHHADTPALCQLMCQESVHCENWLWASDLVSLSSPAMTKMCSLKSADQVQGALNVVTSVDNWPDVGPTMNTKWCNYGTEHECATNHYDCLSCNKAKRCVWESDMHVSGWKYCVSHDSCKVEADHSYLRA